jgi:hypothetical protein
MEVPHSDVWRRSGLKYDALGTCIYRGLDGGVYLEFGIRQAETERAIAAANGCSRELSSSFALLLKPLPIVGASCEERLPD